MPKKTQSDFDRFATKICENIARNLGLPKIEVLVRRQKRADARKRRAAMKWIVALMLVLPGFASAAEMHWCEKANGVGGSYPVCPDDYTQKDGAKYVAPPVVRETLPYIGMPISEAGSLGGKWKYVGHKNVTRAANGTREQWVYTDVNDMPIWYLYFTNGKLTAIQD